MATLEEKKKLWRAKEKYLEENVEPITDNFTQIDDVEFRHPSVTICPIDWGGGSVTIDYEDIDTLIKELKASKEIIEKYKKFEEKLSTNGK
jgi:hypothetical protein